MTAFHLPRSARTDHLPWTLAMPFSWTHPIHTQQPPPQLPPPTQLQPPPPAPRPTIQAHRHGQRTRFYAHHVQESLSRRVGMTICAIFLSILFLVGLILFILWLSLRPHRPRFHIESFSVPGLNSKTGLDNSDIVFDVSIRNPNQNIGIYYDAMDGALFYRDRRIGVTSVMLPFYQTAKNTTTVHGVFAGSSLKVGDDDRAKMAIEAATGRVWFRLELTAMIRFKVTTWDTHRHWMHVECDVVVGPDGSALPESKMKRCSIYFS